MSWGFVGSAAIGAYSSRKSRKSAERSEARSRADMQRAFEQIRSPEDILRQAYTSGIYSPELMSTVIRGEERLLPEFQRLGETAARGVSRFQEQSKLRQLDLLGRLSGDVRGALEDPRLARLAELDIAEAERLSAEAAAPLSGERARQAEQSALQMAVQQGRGRGQGAIAQAVLGRAGASDALSQLAGSARQRALQSSTAALVDTAGFLLKPTSTEEQIFLQSRLGPQITDPGQAINLGSARDVQRGNILIGQGALSSQAGATRAAIGAQQAATAAQLLGNVNFGQFFGSRGANPSIGGVAAYGQNLLGQAGQLSNQISNIGNIGLTGNPMQPSTPFGGYTIQ